VRWSICLDQKIATNRGGCSMRRENKEIDRKLNISIRGKRCIILVLEILRGHFKKGELLNNSLSPIKR